LNRFTSSVAWAAGLALMIGIAVYAAFVTRASNPFVEPTPLSGSAPDGLERFYEQDVQWQQCGSGSAHCGWVTVPVDYAKPSGETTRLRVKIHPGDGATRSLLVNPGGPGGSAIEFADSMFNRLSSDVLKVYDVVGVDPRGVGQSSPLQCLNNKEFDAYIGTDATPDTSAEVDAAQRAGASMGQACLDNSGALAGHVSTVEVARDMDVVRSLLGRERLDWFGASYGTLIGAVYAELFPQTVGRMVLDGAIDPSEGPVEANLGQATGFQRALQAYVDDCVKDKDCPLGKDPDAAIAMLADFMQQLDAQPLPAGKGRVLTEGHALYGLALPLYDASAWDFLTDALTDAFDGDGKELLSFADLYFERSRDGTFASNSGQVIAAVNCLDDAERPTVADVRKVLPQFTSASPVFGPAMAWSIAGCASWPAQTTNPVPNVKGEGAAPIVVLGTTRDPATPYEASVALAKQLESGVLVTREGDGHTAYTAGNSCIVDAVDAYLVGGKAPADGLRCSE
jgi:pimeloyl-ACP methyl ester carboxylesterase